MNVKPRTNLMLDTVIGVLFIVVLVTGLLLWVAYPQGAGRQAGRRGASESLADPAQVLGLEKHDLTALHNWGGVIMGGLVLVHLIFHWKWVVCQAGRLVRRAPPSRSRAAMHCPEN